MKKIIILTIAMLQCACANNFEKFYTSTNALDTTNTNEVGNIDTKLYISNFSDIRSDTNKLLTDNYIMLGSSSFYSPAVSNDDALNFGKKINADIVMLYLKHKDTVTSTAPITTPTFSTVNTTYYSSYGGYGYANSTINGSKTTYYTSTTDRYDYFASYWKQNPKKLRLGIHFELLTEDIKHQIQTNKGIIVTVVVKGTPAFANDILVGDVITKVNGQDVYDGESYTNIMDKIPENSSVEYTIIRDGKIIKKKFKI